MLSQDEIKAFMDSDAGSPKKRLARTGQRYYEGDHDIRDSRIFFFDAEGNLQEDQTKSNIKIPHPFFMELVDQEVQYLLSGKEGFVRSDIPELQAELNEAFNENEDFMAELHDVLTGCIAKGFEYAYAYKNQEGKIAFQCADSLGVVEVRAQDTSDGLEHIIYWYVDRVGKDLKPVRRIQVWDQEQTFFYVQQSDGMLQEDADEKCNPRPHVLYQKEGDEALYFEPFGFLPFFRLDNCKKQYSGLRPIKALIDDYDLMSCGLSNNIQDMAEALYVVRGFKGDNLDELMTNIKAKKHIGVDEEGGVDIKTIEIPYQARQAKLELDEKNIYRFGMGFNSSQVGDGNITNVVIKSRYTLLDLKCGKLKIRLKQFMRKLLKVVLEEINREKGASYRQKDVYFVLDPQIPTNEQESAQNALTEAQRRQTEINTLLALATQLGNEKMMELIAEQLDLDWEKLKSEIPKPAEEDDPYRALETEAHPGNEGVVIE